MEKVNVLGTEYKILVHKISEDTVLERNHFAGYCNENAHEIIIADMSEEKYFPDMTDAEIEMYRKSTMRHEIVHAFLSESGLSANTIRPEEAWAKNEEMIDWIAIQFPKMLEVFKQVNCI